MSGCNCARREVCCRRSNGGWRGGPPRLTVFEGGNSHFFSFLLASEITIAEIKLFPGSQISAC